MVPMQVTFTTPVSSVDHSYATDTEYELPELLASQWIACGYCEAVEAVEAVPATPVKKKSATARRPRAVQTRKTKKAKLL